MSDALHVDKSVGFAAASTKQRSNDSVTATKGV